MAIQPKRPFFALWDGEYEILMQITNGDILTIGSDIPLKGYELDEIKFIEYVKQGQHELYEIAKKREQEAKAKAREDIKALADFLAGGE